MAMVEASVEIDAPLSMTYNQWTQFEEFPRFMDGVEVVEQLDDTTLRWRVELAGATREFVTDITTQQPDECIAWTAREGQGQSGVVRFEALPERGTRVHVRLDYDVEGWTDAVARALNLVDMRAKDDLRRFKDFLENRDSETGAWRGAVRDGEATGTSSSGQVPTSPDVEAQRAHEEVTGHEW